MIASGLRAARRIAAAAGVAAATAARAARLGRRGARARDRARLLRDSSRRVLELHGVAVELDGALPAGPAVLVSNHVSWLDPLAIAAVLPCAPISKAEVGGWPVVGHLARRLGVLFHARGSPASGREVLHAAAAALGAGVPVLNFPEGTTTAGDRVLPFRPAIFALARRAGVPIVPVALRCRPASLAWTGDASFLPHYLRLAAGRSWAVEVRVGAPIETAGAGAEPLAGLARARVVELLAAPPARRPPRSPAPGRRPGDLVAAAEAP